MYQALYRKWRPRVFADVLSLSLIHISTNVIAPPLAAVITAISLDHTQMLGDTVEPVSYTHLDVYKRQLLCYIPPCCSP